jgi:cardiolipin synthase
MRLLKFIKKNEKNIKSAIIFVSIILSVIILFQIIVFAYHLEVWETSFFLMLKKFVNGFFVLYLLFICIVIFFENKDPASTVAWLLVLILLPILGFVLYILFGRNIGKKFKKSNKTNSGFKKLKRAEIQKQLVEYLPTIKNDETKYLNKYLVKLLLNNASSPFSINNKVEVLVNGNNTYFRMLKDIRDAKESIHFQFFIIKNDGIGNEFKKALIRKSKEGIKVRIIYDSVGCWKLGKNYINELKESGIEVYPYSPVMFPLLSRDLNYRNHRKIIVIDGKIGFVGGLNIGDEYLGKNIILGFWRDTHLRMIGNAVLSLQEIFLRDWETVSGENIYNKEYYPKTKEIVGESLIQIVSSGPDSEWQCIMKAYFMMISKAKKRIWINTPYLVPEESLRLGLVIAALSGIDVRIIIPNKPDHYFVYWASRDNIEEFLKAGVKVYTYEKGFIHSKIVLVDSITASVGTANFDYRSLEINYEVNAFIYDPVIVRDLEKNFLRDLKHSKEIILEEHLNRGLKEKFLEATGRFVSPLQ